MSSSDPDHSFTNEEMSRLPRSYCSKVLNLILDYFKENRTVRPLVLDLAMGLGDSSEYLEKRGMGVTKADLSMPVLEANKGERVRCFADELPFKTESFGAIHFKDALVHVEDREKLFKECGRVIKQGGILILTTDLVSDSFFQFRYKENGIEKVSREFFEDFDDYLKKTAYVRKKYDTDLLGPPYFSVGDEELKKFLHKNKFKIVNNFDWQAEIGENDWYGAGYSRKVFVAIKK